MGAYINPKDMSKEEFLMARAKPIGEPKTWDFAGPTLPVCWMDNGAFTAAGICFDQGEIHAFTRPDDNRPRTWFEASKDALYEVSDLEDYMPRPKNLAQAAG